MKRLLLLAALILAAPASARVPSSKAITPVATGARGDITVPFTTNGRSTLGVANGVSAKLLASPELNETQAPKIQNVYNVIIYGSRLGPSTGAIWATPRQPNNLRGNQLRPER